MCKAVKPHVRDIKSNFSLIPMKLLAKYFLMVIGIK
jgi:hypothetical protein